MPNPTDLAYENLSNATSDQLPYDVFFCGNSDEHTERKKTIYALKDGIEGDDIVFKTFGYFGEPNVWGRDYDAVLAKSKMGLSLNRQEGDYLYSSARLAQLMGNGIVPLIHRGCHMEDLLGEERAVFFDSVDDLLTKVRGLVHDDAQRKDLAQRGQDYYREHFSSEHVAQYIVEKTMDRSFSRDYIWSGY